jgi:hypothetical protein
MTLKEKAQELVDMTGMSTSTSFNHINGKYEPIYRNPYAKQCALVVVKFARENTLNTDEYNNYLDEVEQEIKKL